MTNVIVTAMISFITTSMDNLLVLMTYYAKDNSKQQRVLILVGQILGIMLITGAGIIGAYGVSFIPEEHVGLLGIIPFLIGIHGFVTFFRRKHNTEAEHPDNLTSFNRNHALLTLLQIAIVIIADGADNISIYIPLFARYDIWQIAVTAFIFVAMTPLWCLLAKLVLQIRAIALFLEQHNDKIVPLIFVCLGIYIILEGYVFG